MGHDVSHNGAKFDPVKTLTNHASEMNRIRRAALWPRVSYEAMSGALIWSDETKDDTPTEVIWALRAIWAYRTSLMLDDPREELKPYWDLGLEQFPRWVGFRPRRRKATPRLLSIHRRGDVSLRWCLRDLDSQAKADARR